MIWSLAHLAKLIFCSYCSHKAENTKFTTDNQKQFMKACCQAIERAMRLGVGSVFDLAEAAKGLSKNRPTWVLTEENQQQTYSCKDCSQVFNILGEFGNCPGCGKRNYGLVFQRRIGSLESVFNQSCAELKGRERREEEWKSLLVRCVSAFEALANDMREQLLRVPAVPRRKADLSQLSFHNIRRAHKCFEDWFGIEILKNFDEAEMSFLNKMIHRRHLVEHRGGQVDVEYVKNTNDLSVRINQTIRIRSSEVQHLLNLTEKAGKNLIAGFESIF